MNNYVNSVNITNSVNTVNTTNSVNTVNSIFALEGDSQDTGKMYIVKD